MTWTTLNAILWATAFVVAIWDRNRTNKLEFTQRAKQNTGPVAPGLYKAKYAKNTILEVFDEYNWDGDVRISLKEGGNLGEDENGVGFWGLMPDVDGKKRYYPKDALKQYFYLVVE
jgi:hypothetical protein